MIDGNLAHRPTAGRREDRYEAVQFAVQPDFVENLAAIAFEAAVVVVQLDTGEHADEPVEDARRPYLVPRIVPHLLPAADAIEPLVDFGQKARNFARVVLQVGVESHD